MYQPACTDLIVESLNTFSFHCATLQPKCSTLQLRVAVFEICNSMCMFILRCLMRWFLLVRLCNMWCHDSKFPYETWTPLQKA